MAAQTNDAALARLIDRYDVQWVFADHAPPGAARSRRCTCCARGWQPVYVDSAHLVLVRPTPATEAYRRAHAIDLRHAQPGDLVSAPSLRRQQEQNFAAFLAAAAPAPDEPTRQPTE